MKLRPKKTKYNKKQRGRLSYHISSFRRPLNGLYSLIAQESIFLKPHQIECARRVINRYLKRKGKIWIHVFPDLPLSSKPAEMRMGKGKGPISEWVCRICKGKVLFEVSGPSSKNILEGLNAAKKKLPLRVLLYKTPWKIAKIL